MAQLAGELSLSRKRVGELQKELASLKKSSGSLFACSCSRLSEN